MRNYFQTNACCCVKPERVEVLTPPVEPAVTIDTIKAHIGISSAITQFDTILELYRSAATQKIEGKTGYTLITTVFKGFYNCFPACLLIKYKPNLAVSEIKYIDTDDAEQTLAASESNVFTDKFESKVVPVDCWPETQSETPDAVKITFSAGYGAATTDVPSDFQLAIAQVVAFMYGNKGDCPDECVAAACLGLTSISCREDLRALGGCN